MYFVADRHGVSNIYRVELDGGGEATQVTDVQTGVSGITALSPAISVASKAGAVVYAAYRDGAYEIRALGANDAPARGDAAKAPLTTTQPLSSVMAGADRHAGISRRGPSASGRTRATSRSCRSASRT
jgi:hypothetical protein